MKLGSENALKAESEKLKKRVTKLLLKVKELVEALRSAGVPIPPKKLKKPKKQPAPDASSNQNMIAEKPLHEEASKDDPSALRVVKCGCLKASGEKKPLKEINPIVTTISSTVGNLPLSSTTVTPDQAVLNGSNIIAIGPSSMINTPIVATRIQSVPIIRNSTPLVPNVANISGQIIRPTNPSVMERIALNGNMFALRNKGQPLVTPRFSSTGTTLPDCVNDSNLQNRNKTTISVVTTTSSKAVTNQSVVNKTQLINLKQNNIISHPIVTPNIQNLPVIEKNILSNLGPGTLILADGRIVNVPPMVPQIVVKPQPAVILMPPVKKKEKLIVPKRREVTKTTFSNKAPIPAIPSFRLEPCPVIKPKKKQKKIDKSTGVENDKAGSNSKKRKLSDMLAANSSKNFEEVLNEKDPKKQASDELDDSLNKKSCNDKRESAVGASKEFETEISAGESSTASKILADSGLCSTNSETRCNDHSSPSQGAGQSSEETERYSISENSQEAANNIRDESVRSSGFLENQNNDESRVTDKTDIQSAHQHSGDSSINDQECGVETALCSPCPTNDDCPSISSSPSCHNDKSSPTFDQKDTMSIQQSIETNKKSCSELLGTSSELQQHSIETNKNSSPELLKTSSEPVLSKNILSSSTEPNGIKTLYFSASSAAETSCEIISNIPPCISSCSEQESIFIPSGENDYLSSDNPHQSGHSHVKSLGLADVNRTNKPIPSQSTGTDLKDSHNKLAELSPISQPPVFPTVKGPSSAEVITTRNQREVVNPQQVNLLNQTSKALPCIMTNESITMSNSSATGEVRMCEKSRSNSVTEVDDQASKKQKAINSESTSTPENSKNSSESLQCNSTLSIPDALPKSSLEYPVLLSVPEKKSHLQVSSSQNIVTQIQNPVESASQPNETITSSRTMLSNSCNSTLNNSVANKLTGLTVVSTEKDLQIFKNTEVTVSPLSDKISSSNITTALSSVDSLLSSVFPVFTSSTLYSNPSDAKSINTLQLKANDSSANMLSNTGTRDVDIYNNLNQTFSTDISNKSFYPGNVPFSHNSLPRAPHWDKSQYNKSLYNPNFGVDACEIQNPKGFSNSSADKNKIDSLEKQNEFSQVTYFGFQNDPIVTSHSNSFFHNLSSCPSVISSNCGFSDTPSVFSYHNNSTSMAPSYSFMTHENISSFSGNNISTAPNVLPDKSGVSNTISNDNCKNNSFKCTERINVGNVSSVYSSNPNNLMGDIHSASSLSNPSNIGSSLPQPNFQSIGTSTSHSNLSVVITSAQNTQTYSNLNRHKTNVQETSKPASSNVYNSVSQLSSHSVASRMYDSTNHLSSSQAATLSTYSTVSQMNSSVTSGPTVCNKTSQPSSVNAVSSSAYKPTSQTNTSYSSPYNTSTQPDGSNAVISSGYNNPSQYSTLHSAAPNSYNTLSSSSAASGAYNITSQTGLSYSIPPTTYCTPGLPNSSYTLGQNSYNNISQTNSLNGVTSSSYSNIFHTNLSYTVTQGYISSQPNSSNAVISSTYNSVTLPVSSHITASSTLSHISQINSSQLTSANSYNYNPQSKPNNYLATSKMNTCNNISRTSQTSLSSSFSSMLQQNGANPQNSSNFLNSNKNATNIYSNSTQHNSGHYTTSYQSCTSIALSSSSQPVYSNSLQHSYAGSIHSNLPNTTANVVHSTPYPSSTKENLPGIFTVLPNASRIQSGISISNSSNTYSTNMPYSYTTSTQSYASSTVGQYTTCIPESFSKEVLSKNTKSQEINISNKNNSNNDSSIINTSKTNIESTQLSSTNTDMISTKVVKPYNDRNKDANLNNQQSNSNSIDHRNKLDHPHYTSAQDTLNNLSKTSKDSRCKDTLNNVHGKNAIEKDNTKQNNSLNSNKSVESSEKEEQSDINKLKKFEISNNADKIQGSRTESNIPMDKSNADKASLNEVRNLDGHVKNKEKPSISESSSSNKSSTEKTTVDNCRYTNQPSYSIEKHLQNQQATFNTKHSQTKSYSNFTPSDQESVNNHYNVAYTPNQRSNGVHTSEIIVQPPQTTPVTSSSHSAEQLSKASFVDVTLRTPEKKEKSVQKSIVISEINNSKGGLPSDFLKSKEMERNTFIPIMDDVRLTTDFSADLFSSLQVPAGGAHAESISPTAAFLLAFPLVSSSRTAENINDNENQENQTSTPTTILQIGNIDPPSSELFHPIDFQKGNPKPTEHFDINSGYLNVNDLHDKEHQSSYKGCEKRTDTFPDFHKDIRPIADKQKPKSVIVTTSSFTQSYNQPMLPCHEYQYCEKDSNQWQQDYSPNNSKEPKKSCTRKKDKTAQKGCFHQNYQEYYSYKDKNRKQQKRISVNWMTTPESRDQSDYHNKESETMNSLLGPPSQTMYSGISLDFPSEPFSDFSSTKKTNNYSWSPSKTLLPTLDSHLMIPSTLPTLVGDLALGTSTPSETYKSFEAPKPQASGQVSKKTSEKLDVNKKTNEFSKNQANFFSVSQLVDPKCKKQKVERNYKRSEKNQKSRNNYNCPKRKEDNCMYYEERNSFGTNQNQYNEKRNPYKGGSYSAESLIGVQHNEVDFTSSFNCQQNANYFPPEFPPPVEPAGQQYGYFQPTPFSGFTHEECQDFGFSTSQRSLDNNKQKLPGRKDEQYTGAGILQTQMCTSYTKNMNYNIPTSHLNTNTTSTLTNFNLSTIFPEMNDQRVGTSGQANQQMNSSYSNSQNYRNHLS